MIAIDAHTHILTEDVMRMLSAEDRNVPVSVTPIDGDAARLTVGEISFQPFAIGGFDIERRLKDMVSSRIDMHVLAPTPQTFFYEKDAGFAETAAMIQNDAIARLSMQDRSHFRGIATLPMQDPQRAATELRRATKRGLAGAMIGSNTNGRNLDDPDLEPLWHVANELRSLIFIHPVNVLAAPRLRPYYMTNLIGNPTETTVAAACLLFSGVTERYSEIRFALSHGGGFLPYQAGRFVHGSQVRPEARRKFAAGDAVIKSFLYDSICHSAPTLDFLVGQAGASRVLLGSDYPFDMAWNCADIVRGLTISSQERNAILGQNAQAILDGAGQPPPI